MSPARKGRREDTYTEPSISGASNLDRPFATVPGSSMMTGSRLPTFALSSFALISCCAAMKRCHRSFLTSDGTGAPRSFAGAPFTGS